MPGIVARARALAARAHEGQTRKGAGARPYLTHCEAVAERVALWGGEDELVAAAWLHDAVEDRADVTLEAIERAFGPRVRGWVAELTDADPGAPRAARKAEQARRAPAMSEGAALIKVADQLVNVADVAAAPDADWPAQARRRYYDEAEAVVVAIRWPLAIPRAEFAAALRRARAALPGVA